MTEGRLQKREQPDVFRYLDYRRFLGDVYKAQKRHGLTYRSFARRARLGAPNYLKLVVDGERNLTPAMALRFAEAADLTGAAAQYFCELVLFCQARSASKKAEHHQRLLSFPRFREAHKLEGAQAAYHSVWYLPAIRELITRGDYEDDPKWLAAQLLPAIKPAEAKQALATLIRLGLIGRDGTGRLRQAHAFLSTGPETQGMHIASYHAEMARRAMAAIELVPAAERDISALTLGMSAGGLARLKQRIQSFRRELLELAAREGECTQVVQLNFHLFPLSRADTATRPARKTRARRRDDDEQA